MPQLLARVIRIGLLDPLTSGCLSLAVQTLFALADAPDIPAETVGVRQSVGLRFSAGRRGVISAIRYYKAPWANDGTSRTGMLYNTASGQRLATTNAFDDSRCQPGSWVRVTLSSPYTIAANTVYTVALDNVLYYPSSAEFFLRSPRTSRDLTTPRHAGVAGAAGGMPDGVYRSRNYYVDIEFTPS